MPSKSRTLNLHAILSRGNDGFVIVDASKKAAVGEHFTANFGVTDDWTVELISTKKFNTLAEALMHADLLGLKNVKVLCNEAGEVLPEFKKLARDLDYGLYATEFRELKKSMLKSLNFPTSWFGQSSWNFSYPTKVTKPVSVQVVEHEVNLSEDLENLSEKEVISALFG